MNEQAARNSFSAMRETRLMGSEDEQGDQKGGYKAHPLAALLAGECLRQGSGL